MKLASNIIFSNGDLDPWGNGGIKTDLGTNLPYVEVVGGAHHFDLRFLLLLNFFSVDAVYLSCKFFVNFFKFKGDKSAAREHFYCGPP